MNIYHNIYTCKNKLERDEQDNSNTSIESLYNIADVSNNFTPKTIPETIKINEIKDYWLCMGLLKSQCVHYPHETGTIDIIKSNNVEFFRNLYTTKVKIKNICIDGLCAVGKSSCDFEMYKVNKDLHQIGMNSHISSSIGYYYTSLKILIETKSSVVFDRVAYNNIYPWAGLWEILGYMEKHPEIFTMVDSNSYTKLYNIQDYDAVMSDEALSIWRSILEAIHSSVLADIVTTTRTILIVDSDETTANLRLRNRNAKNDRERSYWKHYIRIQNYAYALLAQKFPKYFCIIDMNTFPQGESRQTIMQATIKNIINSIDFKKIKSTNSVGFEKLNDNFPKVLKHVEIGEKARTLEQTAFTTLYKHGM